MNVFLLEYRGFGISEGSDPSERSLVEDARAALLFLEEKLSRVSHTGVRPASGGEAVSVSISHSAPRAAAGDAASNPWGSRVIVLGSSIGGAVAVQLLSDPAMAARVYCLILENTFTSLPDMARVILSSTLPPIAPCVKHLPDRLLRNQVLFTVYYEYVFSISAKSVSLHLSLSLSLSPMLCTSAVPDEEADPNDPHADPVSLRTGRPAGTAAHDAFAL